MTVVKHFVTFFSPGTLFSEETTREIKSWDVDKAVEMSYSIEARYGAKPYGFCFSTRSNDGTSLDSKETNRSDRYFLGGTKRTREEILAGEDPSEDTLRKNVECDEDIIAVVDNCNSYKCCLPLGANDVILEVDTQRYQRDEVQAKG